MRCGFRALVPGDSAQLEKIGNSALIPAPHPPIQLLLGTMQCALSAKVSVAGQRVTAAAPKQRVAASRLVVRAAEEKTEAPPKEEKKPWSPPALDASAPSPIFGGSTGAWQPGTQTADGDCRQSLDRGSAGRQPACEAF
jgi:hypothetical protein